MKKSLLVTALAMVLALGTLIALAVRLGGTATPVGMIVQHPWGDDSAARGLTVHTAAVFGELLLWDTDYRVTQEQENSRFSFLPQKLMPDNTGEADWKDEWCITQLCRTESGDFVTPDLLTGSGDTNRRSSVRVKDAFAGYALYLRNSPTVWMSDTAAWMELFPVDSESVEPYPFDKIHIPVGDEDQLDEHVFYVREDDYYFEYVFNRQETRSWPYTLGRQGHMLVTLGFAADAPVEPSWAPEGFGLWDVPVTERRVEFDRGEYTLRGPETEKARLVYPLDIVRQRVVALSEGAGGDALLVTAEDGQFVLRVLDARTCALRQELVLGQAEETVWSDDFGERTDFGAVHIRQEKDFTLLTLNDRELLVLEKDGENCRIALRSPLMELGYRRDNEGNRIWTWREVGEHLGDRDDGYAHNPIQEGVLLTGTAMTYEDGKLTLAYHPAEQRTDVFLEIYGDGGMLYGALLHQRLSDQVNNSHYYGLTTPWSGHPLTLSWEG